MSLATAQSADFSRFQKLTKTVYANKLVSMLPDDVSIIANDCPFQGAEKGPGDVYSQPVTLTRPMGITFNNDGSAFALRKGLASLPADAQIRGSEILIRDQISYGIMQRALKADVGTDSGKRAFVNATKHVFAGLSESGAFVRELALLYGGGTAVGASLATISAVSDSSGTLTATISADTWVPAMWMGCENGEYDVYTGSTRRSSAGTDAARTNVFVLTSVAPATRQIVLTSHATNTAAVQVGDVIFFAGQRATDMVGIQAACATSGTLWNISNSTYALWKPQTLAVGGQLTFEAVMAGFAKISEVGFAGTSNLYVSPRTWQDLVDDQAALVRHSESNGGKVKMGYSSIEYVSSTGTVRVKPHKLIKPSVAFALPEGHCMRIGSTDLTFEQPGFGKMLSELPDNAGIQARIYTDQAFFCDTPKAMLSFTSITNSR